MKKTQDTFGASGDKKELGPESQSRPLVTEESNTLFSVYCDIAPNNPNNTASEVGISHRTVKCFEETPETPPSSRAEGLLFLHGLESNPGSALQTEEEAGLP